MLTTMKNISILLFCAFSFAFFQFTLPPVKKLPDLVLKDINGKSHVLQDYGKSGQITIISLWATWCKPCIEEINAITVLLDDWKSKYNVDMVTVSIDDAKTAQKVKPFVDGQGWEMDVLMDANRDLSRYLNVPAPPYMVVVDKLGNIVYEHNGYTKGDEFRLEEELKKFAGAKP